MLLLEFKTENMELIKAGFSDIVDSYGNLDWTTIDNILNNWILEAEEEIKLLSFPANISPILTPYKKSIIKNYLYYKIYLRIGKENLANSYYTIYKDRLENFIKKNLYFKSFIVKGI
jgi:hypothetical protein